MPVVNVTSRLKSFQVPTCLGWKIATPERSSRLNPVVVDVELVHV